MSRLSRFLKRIFRSTPKSTQKPQHKPASQQHTAPSHPEKPAQNTSQTTLTTPQQPTMTTHENAKTQFLEANGVKLAFRVIGSESSASSAPPLLLLNHFRSSIDLWDPLIVNALAASGRLVITYDYAGIGQSSGDVRLRIKEFSADVAAFLAAVLPTLPGSPAQADVLGFSMGGSVAQQLALDAPSLVRKLVLSGTGGSGSTGTLAGLFVRPMTEVQSAIMTNPPQPGPILDAFFPTFVNAKDTAGNAWIQRIMSARAAVAGKDGEPAFASFLSDPTALARLTEAYLRWDADPVPFALLQAIQKDALVTSGDNDLVVPTVNAFALARQLPRANFVMFPGSGHGHLFQFPDFYVKQVVSFLRGEFPEPNFSFGAIPPQLGH